MTKMATANLCEAEIDGIMIAASQLYELKAAEHEDEILLQASQRYEAEAHQEAQQTYLVDNAASNEILLLASQRYEAEGRQEAEQTDLVDNASDEILLLASQRYKVEAQQQAEQADLVDDEILLLASQRYEEEAQQQAETASQLEVVAEEKEDGPLLQASEVRSSRWGNPVSLDDITDVREAGVAKKTHAQSGADEYGLSGLNPVVHT